MNYYWMKPKNLIPSSGYWSVNEIVHKLCLFYKFKELATSPLWVFTLKVDFFGEGKAIILLITN